ncbi:MAG: tRNA lysidine(34) synthetase TilS [Leptospiraceae bacterium]|nr:tRNA lysidine(34) synthetase TilS [Leptospiraceae bacterium]
MKRLSRKHEAYIATGHHTIDFLETVFINMIRGTGPKGLVPLPVYYDNIFRPLMRFAHSDIEKTVLNSSWKIFQDESNEEEIYLRNRIRKKIIPLLIDEGLNPDKLYENFHPEEFQSSAGLRVSKNQSPSLLRIDKLTIQTADHQSLKELLDIHLKIFFLHPLNKNFFSDIKNHLVNGKSFLIENSEAYFWRKKQGDLFVIPKNSILFKLPETIHENGMQFIRWNRKEFRVDEGLKSGFYEDGMKIYTNKMHKSISEIFREMEIPLPVRRYIPILFQNDMPVKILFEMFDSSVKNLTGEPK